MGQLGNFEYEWTKMKRYLAFFVNPVRGINGIENILIFF